MIGLLSSPKTAEGFNKANDFARRYWGIKSNQNSIEDRPCIFLIHQHIEKPDVMKLPKYISEAGIDYYLDIEDPKFQQAIQQNDPVEITQKIKDGIISGTHNDSGGFPKNVHFKLVAV